MTGADYHKRIVEYYHSTENAYKDSWDLDNSHAIHYGYWDEKVSSFPQSLVRMNEVMMEAAGIRITDQVLDAGCGVGGSSIFLAARAGCKVTGITLSERQVQQASVQAKKKGLDGLVDFKVMNYCATEFPDASFDVVWGCESVCYAEDKAQFIKEAFRVLKPGGRLVVADGFVSVYENNENTIIRRWLDGWQVNYLETPERFTSFMEQTGFIGLQHHNITRETSHSSYRMNRYYWLASLYLLWKKLTFSDRATEMQKKNINSCRYQYRGMKKGLWQYGLVVGRKP